MANSNKSTSNRNNKANKNTKEDMTMTTAATTTESTKIPTTQEFLREFYKNNKDPQILLKPYSQGFVTKPGSPLWKPDNKNGTLVPVFETIEYQITALLKGTKTTDIPVCKPDMFTTYWTTPDGFILGKNHGLSAMDTAHNRTYSPIINDVWKLYNQLSIQLYNKDLYTDGVPDTDLITEALLNLSRNCSTYYTFTVCPTDFTDDNGNVICTIKVAKAPGSATETKPAAIINEVPLF